MNPDTKQYTTFFRFLQKNLDYNPTPIKFFSKYRYWKKNVTTASPTYMKEAAPTAFADRARLSHLMYRALFRSVEVYKELRISIFLFC